MRPYCGSTGWSSRTSRTSSAIAGLALAFAAPLSCTVTAPAAVSTLPDLSIMSFNVQNLFDTTHDAGRNDYTYLPLELKATAAHQARCATIEVAKWRDECLYWDWSEEVLARKLEALTGAVLAYGGGRGPDILVLQEVENAAILERWRSGYLASAGYRPAVHLEGDDARGIDVAFFSRLEAVGAPRLHAIEFAGVEPRRIADTRGILEASFALPDGSVLTGFAVHFPAPYHPHEMRIQAYSTLQALVAALPAGRLAFAAGDFNTPSDEDSEHAMLDNWARPHWTVAHDSGCGECRGTYYYAPRDNWSFLDMILLTPSMAPDGEAPWRLRADGVSIANAYGPQVRPDGAPRAFELPDATGVSDHWPIAVRLAYHGGR